MLAHVGPLAVLTNKPLAPSLAILEALGLRGFFSAVLGGDGPHARKPHPDGLLAIARFGAGAGGGNPSGLPAILIGDSPADAQTAEAAGCPFVFARYGFGAGKFGGTPPRTPHVAHHPRDIVGLVLRIRDEQL
jgi:phosphoglycolate phosphatase